MVGKKKKETKKLLNETQELLELGKFYFVNQKFDQAIKEFIRVLDQEPDNTDATYNMAVAYEAANNIEQAKIYYERTIELDPKNESAKTKLAKIVGE
ncbi:tetratricopeptide repeat protein [bacterium]